ncbi:hypothetical protein J6590_096020 [Homalodisca vitripennis]|nr:hypothetical protein J6590_096020 [Homalodisca vitripennis]
MNLPQYLPEKLGSSLLSKCRNIYVAFKNSPYFGVSGHHRKVLAASKGCLVYKMTEPKESQESHGEIDVESFDGRACDAWRGIGASKLEPWGKKAIHLVKEIGITIHYKGQKEGEAQATILVGSRWCDQPEYQQEGSRIVRSKPIVISDQSRTRIKISSSFKPAYSVAS